MGFIPAAAAILGAGANIYSSYKASLAAEKNYEMQQQAQQQAQRQHQDYTRQHADAVARAERLAGEAEQRAAGAEQRAAARAEQATQSFNKANPKRPNKLNVEKLMGYRSTMLTGAAGVEPTALPLGKKTLLGQ